MISLVNVQNVRQNLEIDRLSLNRSFMPQIVILRLKSVKKDRKKFQIQHPFIPIYPAYLLPILLGPYALHQPDSGPPAQ
jgi:hypothetical protein